MVGLRKGNLVVEVGLANSDVELIIENENQWAQMMCHNWCQWENEKQLKRQLTKSSSKDKLE